MEKQPNKLKLPLLIVALVVLLLGGGFAVWSVLKKDEKNETVNTKTSTEQQPLTGRKDESGSIPELPQAIKDLLKSNNDNSFGAPKTPKTPPDPTKPPPPPPPPLYVNSVQAQQLIKAKAERIQGNDAAMNIIRAKYDIGKSLIDFNAAAQGAIDKMFNRVAGVDTTSNPSKRYLTYPIYGTHEQRGEQAYNQLLNLLSKDKTGYTLADTRHGDAPWWIDAVHVNLLIGTDTAHTWSADKIWWYQANRADVDWFKEMNGIGAEDKQLVDGKTGGTAWYWAGNMLTFVRRWVESIQYLDKVTEWEAIRTLTASKDKGGDGWNFTYINPANGVDTEGVLNPKDSTTNDNTDSLILA